MRITDPNLVAMPAVTMPDAESIEMVYSLIVPTLDAPLARQAARLILARTNTDLTSDAERRLTRSSARVLAAEPGLALIAANANHAALTAGLPAIAAARGMLTTAVGRLRAGVPLLRVTTDTSDIPLPPEAAMRAATEAIVGAHTLANSGENDDVSAAEPELRLMALIASTVHDGSLDLPRLEASWRTYVLLLIAGVATGAARPTANDRFKQDAARFTATLMRFRASQLDNLAKLGRSA